MEPVDAALDAWSDQIGAARRLFVGYSGGLDSTVLLHALSRRYRSRLIALHANHGLHADAGAWQRHCDAWCRARDLPLRSRELTLEDDGRGPEAAARAARYAWFEENVAAGDLLLLAHHQDDQAETLLLRLLRGAGPEGLAAMPAQRSIGAGQLLRPLLSLPRSGLAAYARAQGLRWVEDPSNASPDQDRNYLRHTVMPLLEARWPGYRRTFGRAAHQLGALVSAYPGATLEDCESVLGDPGFRLASLPDDPQAAARALRGWLRRAGQRMPSASMLGEFLRQLREGAGARLATADWVLERYRDAVYCYPALSGGPSPQVVTPGDWVPWPAPGRVCVRREAGRDDDGELLLRTRRGGERLATAAGRHRDLKTLFQDCAVPPWWRPVVPLLLRRQGATEELLVVGTCARSPRAVSAGIALDWDPPTLHRTPRHT